MDALAQRLWNTIRKQGLLKPGDRVGVAVSGGADSVALLRLLLELRADAGIVLAVIHINHQLRASESDADQSFVEALAHAHGLECHVRAARVEAGSGVEAEARRLRYQCFAQLSAAIPLTRIATAHTLDDQAETVLMRMLRGTGLRGLAGIHPRLRLDGGAEVVRPLLGVRRAQLLVWLRACGQSWREDSSNLDPTFLRNRVRHDLLPRIEKDFGASAAQNLADLAEIARAEEEHWAAHPEIRPDRSEDLALNGFADLSVAAQRRMIRAWLESNAVTVSFRLIEQVRELALGPSGRKQEISSSLLARRTQRGLCLETTQSPTDYQYRLPIPGEVEVPALGCRVIAAIVELESLPAEERDQALDPARMSGELVVRNWRPGDRFWPAHTREAKKVKDLLNDRHIAGAEKGSWPVAVAGDHGLVWMRGFASPTEFAPAPGAARVLWIRVLPA